MLSVLKRNDKKNGRVGQNYVGWVMLVYWSMIGGPGWASQIAEYFVTHHLSIHLSPISKFSQFIVHNDDGDIDE